jgi:acetyl-CoA carboxylase biotin carboxyl carrier protein
LRQLKSIISKFEESNIEKLEITEKDFTVKLEKRCSSAPVPVSQSYIQSNEPSLAPETLTQEVKQNNPYFEIKAPLVGTFYDAPSPDSKPYVSVNQKVREGDVLFIIEAMKVMNEIKAPIAGVVKSVHTQNASMVEFGQVIMEIEA